MAGVDCETAGCAPDQLVSLGDEYETGEGDDFVTVHRGNIASGERVIKDALLRDQLAQNTGSGILCFEQEAAGVLASFPCLGDPRHLQLLRLPQERHVAGLYSGGRCCIRQRAVLPHADWTAAKRHADCDVSRKEDGGRRDIPFRSRQQIS